MFAPREDACSSNTPGLHHRQEKAFITTEPKDLFLRYHVVSQTPGYLGFFWGLGVFPLGSGGLVGQEGLDALPVLVQLLRQLKGLLLLHLPLAL